MSLNQRRHTPLTFHKTRLATLRLRPITLDGRTKRKCYLVRISRQNENRQPVGQPSDFWPFKSKIGR